MYKVHNSAIIFHKLMFLSLKHILKPLSPRAFFTLPTERHDERAVCPELPALFE